MSDDALIGSGHELEEFGSEIGALTDEILGLYEAVKRLDTLPAVDLKITVEEQMDQKKALTKQIKAKEKEAKSLIIDDGDRKRYGAELGRLKAGITNQVKATAKAAAAMGKAAVEVEGTAGSAKDLNGTTKKSARSGDGLAKNMQRAEAASGDLAAALTKQAAAAAEAARKAALAAGLSTRDASAAGKTAFNKVLHEDKYKTNSEQRAKEQDARAKAAQARKDERTAALDVEYAQERADAKMVNDAMAPYVRGHYVHNGKFYYNNRRSGGVKEQFNPAIQARVLEGLTQKALKDVRVQRNAADRDALAQQKKDAVSLAEYATSIGAQKHGGFYDLHGQAAEVWGGGLRFSANPVSQMAMERAREQNQATTTRQQAAEDARNLTRADQEAQRALGVQLAGADRVGRFIRHGDTGAKATTLGARELTNPVEIAEYQAALEEETRQIEADAKATRLHAEAAARAARAQQEGTRPIGNLYRFEGDYWRYRDGGLHPLANDIERTTAARQFDNRDYRENMSPIFRGATKGGHGLDGLLETFGNFGRFAVVGAALGSVTAALATGVKQVIDYEDSIAGLSIAINDLGSNLTGTNVNLDGFTQSLMASSRYTGGNVGESMDNAGLGALAFGNEKMSKAQRAVLGKKFADQTNVLATISGQSSTDAAPQLLATAKAYGIAADQFNRVSDAIAYAHKKTAASSAEISKGLAGFAPLAKSAGFSPEQAAMMVAVDSVQLNKSGTGAAQSMNSILSMLQGTSGQGVVAALNRIIPAQDRIDPNGSAADKLQQILTVYPKITDNKMQQQFLNSLGGRQNADDLSVLIQNRNSIFGANAFTTAGASAKQFDIITGNISNHLKQIVGDLNNMIVQLRMAGVFDGLGVGVDLMVQLTRATSDLLGMYNQLPGVFKHVLSNVTLLAAAYGVLSRVQVKVTETTAAKAVAEKADTAAMRENVVASALETGATQAEAGAIAAATVEKTAASTVQTQSLLTAIMSNKFVKGSGRLPFTKAAVVDGDGFPIGGAALAASALTGDAAAAESAAKASRFARLKSIAAAAKETRLAGLAGRAGMGMSDVLAGGGGLMALGGSIGGGAITAAMASPLALGVAAAASVAFADHHANKAFKTHGDVSAALDHMDGGDGITSAAAMKKYAADSAARAKTLADDNKGWEGGFLNFQMGLLGGPSNKAVQAQMAQQAKIAQETAAAMAAAKTRAVEGGNLGVLIDSSSTDSVAQSLNDMATSGRSAHSQLQALLQALDALAPSAKNATIGLQHYQVENFKAIGLGHARNNVNDLVHETDLPSDAKSAAQKIASNKKVNAIIASMYGDSVESDKTLAGKSKQAGTFDPRDMKEIKKRTAETWAAMMPKEWAAMGAAGQKKLLDWYSLGFDESGNMAAGGSMFNPKKRTGAAATAEEIAGIQARMHNILATADGVVQGNAQEAGVKAIATGDPRGAALASAHAMAHGYAQLIKRAHRLNGTFEDKIAAQQAIIDSGAGIGGKMLADGSNSAAGASVQASKAQVDAAAAAIKKYRAKQKDNDASLEQLVTKRQEAQQALVEAQVDSAKQLATLASSTIADNQVASLNAQIASLDAAIKKPGRDKSKVRDDQIARNGLVIQRAAALRQRNMDEIMLGADPRSEQSQLGAQVAQAQAQIAYLRQNGDASNSPEMAPARLNLHNLLAQQVDSDLAYADAVRKAKVYPGAAIQGAAATLASARDALKSYKVGTTEWWTKLAEVQADQQAYADAVLADADTARRLAGDMTNPFQMARDDYKNAVAKYNNDKAKKNVAPETLRADQKAKEQAYWAAEDSGFQQKFTLATNAEQLNQMSHAAYMSYLEKQHNSIKAQMKGMKTTAQGYYQLQQHLTQVDQAMKGMWDQMAGQWNLGSIDVPSPFEARRMAELRGGGGVTNDNRTVNVMTMLDEPSLIKLLKDNFGVTVQRHSGTTTRKR